MVGPNEKPVKAVADRIVALLGDDDLGRGCRDELRAEGIDVSTLGTAAYARGSPAQLDETAQSS